MGILTGKPMRYCHPPGGGSSPRARQAFTTSPAGDSALRGLFGLGRWRGGRAAGLLGRFFRELAHALFLLLPLLGKVPLALLELVVWLHGATITFGWRPVAGCFRSRSSSTRPPSPLASAAL